MMNFSDDSDNSWNRERVLERLTMVTLPAGLTPQLQTDWSPRARFTGTLSKARIPTSM
jgi:cobalt-zinc-cadmium resistance protein CzcA